MKFCVFYYISFFFFFYSICVCACVELQDSQVRDVWSIQRGQHAPSSQKAVLHDGKTLQQLLPVNQSPRYSPFTSGCVCACVCLGGSTTVFQIQRSPPRLHSWLGVRTHIKTRCQTTGLIYPRGLIQFVCKSFVLFARLPDYLERKIAKKNKKKKPQQPHTCSLAALQRRGPWFAAARGAGGGTAAGKQSSPPPDLARANTRPRLPHLPLCPSPGKMRASERQKERKRIFSESFFHWNNEQATSPSEPPPPKSCVIYWCLSTQNLRSTIRSQTNRWSQPEKIP